MQYIYRAAQSNIYNVSLTHCVCVYRTYHWAPLWHTKNVGRGFLPWSLDRVSVQLFHMAQLQSRNVGLTVRCTGWNNVHSTLQWWYLDHATYVATSRSSRCSWTWSAWFMVRFDLDPALVLLLQLQFNYDSDDRIDWWPVTFFFWQSARGLKCTPSVQVQL
jgi:hypothetical protein